MHNLDRRQFIQDTAAVAASMVALRSSGKATRAEETPEGRKAGANETVRVAVIGVRGRGLEHIHGFAGLKDVRITTICDVDRNVIGLASNQFKNIILLNGHGGGQTAILSALAQEVGRQTHTRILVINWWSYCSDVVQEVYGEDGGHAGNTETAVVMAVDVPEFCFCMF